VPNDADVIVIGSGFGGGVSALRLTEKGYRVLVLEAGRRFGPGDFPKTTWNLRRFLWFPSLGMRGIQRIDFLGQVVALSGAGVGGGSLVYANTLIEPDEEFFDDLQWAGIADWKAELAPWYDQARRMLGVTEARADTPADQVIAAIARHFGREDTHHPVDVAVYRGEPGVPVPDPFYGGIGPRCIGCIECGGCMVGCRHQAKNTIDRTYLHLAEQGGARVLAEREVVDLVEDDDGGWVVVTKHPGAWLRQRVQTFTANRVVIAAGGLGTTRLLLRLRSQGRLPGMSQRVGHLVRTNSESLTGAVARARDVDYSHGVAITSSFSPTPRTRIEPVRYPAGSNSMGLLASIPVPGGRLQPLRYLGRMVRSPLVWLRSLSVRHWSERGMILLVMQSEDNSVRLQLTSGPTGRRVRAGQGHGTPNPCWLPIAHEAAELAAQVMGGDAMASINESLFGAPLTAHLIGGACIGGSAETGVVDPYHRMFGHPTISVVDGSVVPANLGSNPSLTITAMAERAMAAWPNKGEADHRPPIGEAYHPVQVPPVAPIVPASAPAALRRGG